MIETSGLACLLLPGSIQLHKLCKTTEFAARNPQEWNRLKNWQPKKKSYQQQKGSNKSYANVVEEEFMAVSLLLFETK